MFVELLQHRHELFPRALADVELPREIVYLPFNRKLLILSAVARSGVDPEFRVQFTVKDKSAVKEELFAKASENARKIAEGLCRGVGKKLGDIININYSWQEIDIYHEFDDCCEAECVAGGAAPDINPEDLEASDSVTFTWELA